MKPAEELLALADELLKLNRWQVAKRLNDFQLEAYLKGANEIEAIYNAQA